MVDPLGSTWNRAWHSNPAPISNTADTLSKCMQMTRIKTEAGKPSYSLFEIAWDTRYHLAR